MARGTDTLLPESVVRPAAPARKIPIVLGVLCLCLVAVLALSSRSSNGVAAAGANLGMFGGSILNKIPGGDKVLDCVADCAVDCLDANYGISSGFSQEVIGAAVVASCPCLGMCDTSDCSAEDVVNIQSFLLNSGCTSLPSPSTATTSSTYTPTTHGNRTEMKVALCFWGLTRSLKHTIQSIHEQIIAPLKGAGIEYKIFLHTFSFKTEYNNPRAHETGIKLDFQEYELLNPDYFMIEDQDEVKKRLNVTQYRSKADPWSNGYISLDNFICAMYSKKQVGSMIKKSGEVFDNFIFLRPDVQFLNPISVDYLPKVSGNKVYCPNFQLFSNFNDRFFICSREHVYTYTQLFDDMLPFSRHSPLHSETFQYKMITQKYGLIVIYIDIHFNRIRANGKTSVDYRHRVTNSSTK